MLRAHGSILTRYLINSIAKSKLYHGGNPGDNFPMAFGELYKITGIFLAYFGVPLGAPFFVVWYQYKKKAA